MHVCEKRARRWLSAMLCCNPLSQIAIVINHLSLAGLHWLVGRIDGKKKSRGGGGQRKGGLERDKEGSLDWSVCVRLEQESIRFPPHDSSAVCGSQCVCVESVRCQSVTKCSVIVCYKCKIAQSPQCSCPSDFFSGQTGARRLWARCLTVCVGVYSLTGGKGSLAALEEQGREKKEFQDWDEIFCNSGQTELCTHIHIHT